jgi:nucleoid-associated protein YgaU
MNRTFAARGVLISLVVLVGVAALIWWLISSGRFDGSLKPSASKAPADQSKPVVSAPAPEKPASAIAEANKTIKDLGDRLAPLPPASTDPAPAFDVARVESNGEAVIAGRSLPNSSVELLVDGKVHDRTTADSSGAFVFVPRPLPPGKYDLTLRATAPDGKVMVSKSPVAVALVASDQAPVAAVVPPKSPAAAPPSSSTVPPVAAVPPAAPAEAAKARDDGAAKSADLRIESVEPEAGGGLFVSGRAAPGSRVRLYINDGYIAMGTASPEGRVSFSIQSGVRPGDYRIRLDQMSASDSVASRVEQPFRAPATVAAPSVASKTPDAPAAPESVVASKQPAREPAPAASIVSPPPAPVVTDQKPAAPAPVVTDQKPPAPAALPSQPSPSQPVSPAPKDLASGPAKEAPVRSAEPATRAPSSAPVASAPPSKSAAAPGQVQVATPATEPNTRSAQTGKADAAASQPPASSSVVAAPVRDPKVASNMSPRIAEPTKERRDAVVIPRIDTKLIVRGDNLWRISEATYGMGRRYTVIFGANRDKIRNPDLIYPGQIFVLPKPRSGQ